MFFKLLNVCLTVYWLEINRKVRVVVGLEFEILN